jgi:hypothetical protein
VIDQLALGGKGGRLGQVTLAVLVAHLGRNESSDSSDIYVGMGAAVCERCLNC